MPSEKIEGVVQTVMFYNPDNGWTVLSLDPKKPAPGKRDSDEVIVVGKLFEVQPGESVRFTGTWTVHKEYGQQFKAETMRLLNDDPNDIERFLFSGQIEGVGKRAAQQIVEHFGAEAMTILDAAPERIHEVRGLKPNAAEKIAMSWTEARKSRKAMLFLQEYNLTATQAHKIYEMYGDDTIEEIQRDPYKLTLDIEGIGFKTADQIAQTMDISADAVNRVRAGVLHALTLLSSDGHIYLPRPLLVEKASELLGVPAELCENAMTSLLKRKEIVAIKKMPSPSGVVEAVYLKHIHEMEQGVAQRLHALNAAPKSLLGKAQTLNWEAFFARIGRKANIQLTRQQQGAVKAALTNRISVLTGGPGTGKTTTLRAVIQALDSIKAQYALASPTGRAARRLNEATQHDASTIHRMLGYSPEMGFMYGADNQLDVDMVIVDEASMIDLDLFSHLLDAIKDGAHLMLVGDVDQLPSVGAGDVLHDVIRSGIAHVTRLEAIFRQASDSMIVVNAHRVNQGEMPDLSNSNPDFFLFGVGDDDYANATDLLVDVVQNRIPKRFGLNPLDDVQVLAPMYKGDVGIHTLNERLQAALNPLDRYSSDHQISGRSFRLGDKVIQTRNNYEKDIYNGDIGRVVSIDPVDQKLEINVEGRIIEYEWKETGDLFLAYAISIHRSQGGEYPAVVVPVVTQHSRMLQRNLLYTAITRAKKLVVLVGTRRAIQIAVENDRVMQRYSGLIWQLENLNKNG